MTRKDYEKIAAILADKTRTARILGDGVPKSCKERAQAYGNCAKETIDDIADMLAADNPRFDRARFLAACGLEE